MAKMLKDEVAVIKAVAFEIDDGVIGLLTGLYHTEANPETGKIDRSKSFYRWVLRVDKKDNFSSLVTWYLDDSRRLERGTWPDDKSGYFFCVSLGSENFRIGGFFETKLKKLKSWEDGWKVLNGWETQTDKRAEGYNLNAKYVIEGYKDASGSIVDISKKEELMKHIGENLIAVPSSKKTKTPLQQKAVA